MSSPLAVCAALLLLALLACVTPHQPQGTEEAPAQPAAPPQDDAIESTSKPRGSEHSAPSPAAPAATEAARERDEIAVEPDPSAKRQPAEARGGESPSRSSSPSPPAPPQPSKRPPVPEHPRLPPCGVTFCDEQGNCDAPSPPHCR